MRLTMESVSDLFRLIYFVFQLLFVGMDRLSLLIMMPHFIIQTITLVRTKTQTPPRRKSSRRVKIRASFLISSRCRRERMQVEVWSLSSRRSSSTKLLRSSKRRNLILCYSSSNPFWAGSSKANFAMRTASVLLSFSPK